MIITNYSDCIENESNYCEKLEYLNDNIYNTIEELCKDSLQKVVDYLKENDIYYSLNFDLGDIIVLSVYDYDIEEKFDLGGNLI